MSTDFGASISEEPLKPTLNTTNIRQDQFGRTVIELSESHDTSSSNFSKTPSGSASPATNGISNELDAERSHSVYSSNSEDKLDENQKRDKTSELTRKEEQAQESNKEEEKKSPNDNNDKVSTMVQVSTVKSRFLEPPRERGETAPTNAV